MTASTEEPRVVNRHHYRYKTRPTPWMYVGRGTPLGNPFTAQEHGVNTLELYRRWLWGKIRSGDTAVRAALESITAEHHLACSCKPRPCHADVIVRAWVWMQREVQTP